MNVSDVSLVARVTEQCNLDCSYCYMDKKESKSMSLTVAQRLIEEFMRNNQDFAHFTWIGGEPLVRNDSFYSEIRRISDEINKLKQGLDVTHSIQTNGLALTEKRAKRLKDLGFKLGVSYDGSPILQDELRHTNNRVSISRRIVKNIQSAKPIGLISVLTRKSVGREEEIYKNLKALTNVARLNLYAPSGEGLLKVDSLLPSKKYALSMLMKFYILWRDDKDKFTLEPFQDMAQALVNGIPRSCEFSAVRCYQIVGSDTEGNIYTCSRSTHNPETKMGNIFEKPLEEILKASPRIDILRRHLKLREEKKDCRYFSICSGGCPVEATSHNGSMMSGTYYCCEVKGEVFRQIENDMRNGKLREKVKI